MNSPEYEYVELVLTVENGVVTSCEHFGEGKQVEPVKPSLYSMEGKAVPQDLSRRILRAIKNA